MQAAKVCSGGGEGQVGTVQRSGGLPGESALVEGGAGWGAEGRQSWSEVRCPGAALRAFFCGHFGCKGSPGSSGPGPSSTGPARDLVGVGAPAGPAGSAFAPRGQGTCGGRSMVGPGFWGEGSWEGAHRGQSLSPGGACGPHGIQSPGSRSPGSKRVGVVSVG